MDTKKRLLKDLVTKDENGKWIWKEPISEGEVIELDFESMLIRVEILKQNELESTNSGVDWSVLIKN